MAQDGMSTAPTFANCEDQMGMRTNAPGKSVEEETTYIIGQKVKAINAEMERTKKRCKSILNAIPELMVRNKVSTRFHMKIMWTPSQISPETGAAKLPFLRG